MVPIFSLAYVKQNRDSTGYQATRDSQSIKAICIGNDKKSNGLLFYLLSSKSLISSLDYRLDAMVPSGPIFNLQYNGCIGFDLYGESSESFQPPLYEVGESIWYKSSDMPKYAHGTILVEPSETQPLATIQDKIT
eukprot:5607143-Ditylum_brightwellii.AAC.1